MIKWFLWCWLLVLFAGIAYLFWDNEIKYSLPTPVPNSYKPAKTGSAVKIKNIVKLPGDKPIFLHFFNPDCPCSRFNIPQVQLLVKQYGDKVTFAIIVLTNNNDYTIKDIQRKFDLNIPVFFDQSIADSCGVYSTPQAVVLDPNYQLYYRGNYNKNRYCILENSNYAKMAIDSLLNNQITPAFTTSAFKSYGCQLPNCNK